MRAMIIDFHTHSHASDGALPPAELLRRASAAGVSRMAITDHDTVAGYREAVASGQVPEGMQLVPGVELSCQWSGATVHVVGLDIDPEHPELAAGLDLLARARQQRAHKIADRLAGVGIAGALEGALQVAGVSQVGRPHFARWLVEQGHVEDAGKAFDRYLGSGKLGDVKTFWPELEEVTRWIVSSGGTAVLAHPLKYRFTRMKLRRLVKAFVEAGGTALEIFSGRQTNDQTIDLCRLADEYGLRSSAGSDYHADSQYGPTLGVDASKLPVFVPFWQPRSSRETAA